jgi:predicted phosphate transport protein (TIGR00153 family)
MFGINQKEQEFYNLFNETMLLICQSSEALLDLLTNFEDVKEKAGKIKQIELDCDNQTHKVLEVLNSAFITPFDREDMYQIIKSMDNIVDDVEEIANRFSIFNVKIIKSPTIEMANLIKESTLELKDLFENINQIGKNDIIMNKIIEINRLENEGDFFHRKALEELFNNETDSVELIKWKYLFELLEQALDDCEGIANLVQGLIMKHSN